MSRLSPRARPAAGRPRYPPSSDQPRPPSSLHPTQRPVQAAYSRPYDSRASYPAFLSLFDTVRLQLSCAVRGFADAFRWDVVARLLANDAAIRGALLKSLLLNVLALASVAFFDILLAPLGVDVQNERSWMHRNVGWAYQVLWLLPVVGISLYLNTTYCSFIAKRTFALSHGPRAGAAPPATYSGLLNALATSAYGGIMVISSIAVSFSLRCIPRIGGPASFVFLCWVDAYYCFEHVWIARGLSLARRVRHLEERWAYYFAFGLPTAALCTWGSSLANAALFALVFPAYIIMAMHARPVPLDPYNPLPAPAQTRFTAAGVEAETDIRHPHPLVPIRLPIYAPVLWLNDGVVRVLSMFGGKDMGRSANVGGSSLGSANAGSRRRALSDTAESIEQGEAGQWGSMTGVGIELTTNVGPGIPGRTRVRLGGTAENDVGGYGRRKVD
ncbi:uncharacterized protein FIBRA_08272 [Fibroporia radiculosa]|uniref:Etoposide-induced protein 2.4-domain-containing protein n=1 Tax=Fibroporia radiculosa TaxID=599839 RepID=J4I2G6_9APHY|nr:uncharacterized protein FIBRA_08272 [Fibroporia radiculosa]CCM06027.1 predicted protein [Fibroporia radiculosa]